MALIGATIGRGVMLRGCMYARYGGNGDNSDMTTCVVVVDYDDDDVIL